MKTIILKRPKDKEQYYDESNFKIYINGKLVEKLGQNDTKEITIEDDVIEIQARTFGFDGSAKEKIELEDKTELEIVRVLYWKKSSLIAFIFPIFFTILYNLESQWIKVSLIVFAIIIFGLILLKYVKNKDKTITITKI